MNGLTPAGAGRTRPSVGLALATTSLLLVLPLATAWAIQKVGPPHAFLLSVLGGIFASVVTVQAGTFLWARFTRAGERVFGDITLWGLIRYVRATRKIERLEAVMADRDMIGSEQIRTQMIELADALERRDSRTHGHSRRVARHAAEIAREMGLNEDEIARVRFAAAMHDIGKLRTPDEVLFKPGKLTSEEFDIIKRHPVDSAELVDVLADEELIAIIRGHHERFDGDGYPDGLAGQEIPLGARIIAVADTFDALVSDRPYREGVAHKQARAIISEGAGSQWDPVVVEAFKEYYRGGDWQVAWGVLSALPPRIASSLTEAVRGGASATFATAAPTVAAVALAVGAVSTGAPALAEGLGLQTASKPANATVDGATVTLKNGRKVVLPPGVKVNAEGVPVDAQGNPVPVDSLPTADGTAPAAPGADGVSGGNSESGSPQNSGDAGSEPGSGSGSGSRGESEESSSGGGKSTGEAVEEVTKETTKNVGDTVKGVGETVGGVGETVEDVGGGNEVTETVGQTVGGVGETVKETGDTVGKVGSGVGGAVGGILGGGK